jgi:predicted permease
MKHKPKSFITAEEAHSLLNVSRSTLSRYVKNGTITPFKVLMKDAKGTRLQHLFLKSEVRRLSYFLTAIRMIGIPGALGGVLYLCGVRGDYLFWPLVFACLPLGLNLVVYPESLGYEKEAADNAKLCFISYVLSLGVLPCLFAFLQWLCY